MLTVRTPPPLLFKSDVHLPVLLYTVRSEQGLLFCRAPLCLLFRAPALCVAGYGIVVPSPLAAVQLSAFRQDEPELSS